MKAAADEEAVEDGPDMKKTSRAASALSVKATPDEWAFRVGAGVAA